MKDRIINSVKIIMIAALTVFAAFQLLSDRVTGFSGTKDLNAEKGRVVLQGDYGNRIFALNGEWEYYPNELLEPSDFIINDYAPHHVTFPHYWKNDAENFPDGKGYATYRMMIETPDATISDAGIFSEFQYGAYRIYLNGVIVAVGGNVAENKDDYYFAYNGSAGFSNPKVTGQDEIIVQVQSYDHTDGGLGNRIIIGSADNIERYHTFLTTLLGTTAGAIFVLMIYFLLLFFQNKDKKEYLNFAVVSMCCLYLTLSNCGGNIIYYTAPSISSHLLYKLEFISYMVGTYFAAMHVIKKYIKLPRIKEAGMAYVGLNCLLVVFLPTYPLSQIRHFLQAAMFLLIFTALIISFINAFGRKAKVKNGFLSMLEFCGLLILFGGTLFSQIGVAYWKGFDLFPVFALIYCLIQIFVLSGHYKNVENNLVKLTKTLENRVAERTAALGDLNKRVKAANDIKTEFLTRMGNEIRMPMNAIVEMSDLLNIENMTEEQKGYFQDIKETSHSLLSLINDIMDFSKIEEGKLELVPAHFELNPFIENICSSAKRSAEAKNLSFEKKINGGLPEVIYADEIRMKQVISKFLSNAVKYTREGGVTADFTVSGKAGSPECTLIVTVKDTGKGIRKENIPHLFDGFMNPSVTRMRGIVGTGLGMAISKKLTDMMKGKIEVESEHEKGSVFKLYFPLITGDKSLIEGSDSKVGEKIYAKNAKILLVDDNEINIMVALGILATHDITPDVAKNGYKAIEMIEKNDYDLVFMDQFMPEMNGTETVEKIRGMGGKYKTLPVIALTSDVSAGAKDMMLFRGMNDYISKPVDHSALNNVLAKWLPYDKINSALGRFGEEQDDEKLFGLPQELVEINELNYVPAIKKMNGNIDIYIRLLRQLTHEADDYVRNLEHCLEIDDLKDYIIIVNGIKNLLYNIGAKTCGDLAAQLERDAAGNKVESCKAKTGRFCENMKWLAQRIKLALPPEENE
ncbi:MAG: ATP-binding protein [Oscillospiraceae bacterium]|nr:ATP-binding protein [Oscillospiraceae bacterium]